MRVRVESNHATAGARGRLRLIFLLEKPELGQTVVDDVWFSVPSDFHAHPDSVAAAALTLIGKLATAVEYNFPISEPCAALLRAYYQLEEIGPVDAALEPRQPGRFVGLNFSGGIDSVAVWVILRELMGQDIKVVHGSYGAYFVRERAATAGYHKDVDCASNIRAKGYDEHGRFLLAVPLLHADYADLGSVVSGNPYFHYPPLHVESLADGRPPAFLAHDAVVNAGGLAELHLIRGLMTRSTLKMLVAAAPQRVEAALYASAAPGDVKHAIKSLTLRDAYERLGMPLPDFLRRWTPPAELPTFGERLDVDTWALYFLRSHGPEFVSTFVRGLDRLDLTPLDGVSFDFLTRYNASLISLVPEPLRREFTRVLHSFDIYPYTERDWLDLDRYRAFLLEHRHATAG